MATKATPILKIFIAVLVLHGHFAVAEPAEGGAGPVAAAAAPAAELLARCARCHDADGVASSPTTPHLDGQLQRYLGESIELLISGERPATVDNHFPAGLSRAEILGLASHYSELRRRRSAEETDSDKVLEGEMIYMERCMACHDDYGRSTDNIGLGSPLLAGQRLGYLREQMLAYLSKKRQFWGGMKEAAFSGQSLAINGHPVREAIGALGEAEVEALAHFFASISPASASGRKRR
jgi:cytochrome c553